jgi:adenosylcobinamide-phosphate synthase
VIALLAAAGLGLDWLLGEPARWHPLALFGAYARRIELAVLPQAAGSALWARALGVLALVVTVAPWVLLCARVAGLRWIGPVWDVAILYLAIGHRSLHEHARRVRNALARGDLEHARRDVGMMVSRDTADMDVTRVSAAAVESVLENGNDAVFGALFWFVVAGAPGALAYRLINTLDAMWGYRTARYLHFGWAAARLDDVMNFVPARLTALTYALVGRGQRALHCWRSQAPLWDSPNAGPVMAAGAGALGVSLGGGAFYAGEWHERAALGEGAPAGPEDITRALRLVGRSVLLWLAVIAVASALFTGLKAIGHA